MTFAMRPAFPATDVPPTFAMINRMLTAGLLAGFAAGLLAALLHFAFVQDLILTGEAYETGQITHFGGTTSGVVTVEQGAHSHAEGAEAHSHDAGIPAPQGMMRNALTVLFSTFVYVGYGIVLVAGFAFAANVGIAVGPAQGVLWGIAGFAAFQLAPAIGLPPELPGTLAAELASRQVWWWGTALATAVGLGLLGYGKSIGIAALGLVLVAAPHVIGAPQPDGYSGVAPPELAAAFSARVLGVGLVVWAVMGGVAARFWTRPSEAG